MGILLNSEGTLQLFARGKENRALMYNGQTHNVSGVFWGPWQNLGGILTSGPTAVLTAESLVHVFVRGIDKGLFEKREVANHLTGVSWSRWESLGGVLSSHPNLPTVLNPVNLLEVFVRQADKAIWHKKQLATTSQPACSGQTGSHSVASSPVVRPQCSLVKVCWKCLAVVKTNLFSGSARKHMTALSGPTGNPLVASHR